MANHPKALTYLSCSYTIKEEVFTHHIDLSEMLHSSHRIRTSIDDNDPTRQERGVSSRGNDRMMKFKLIGGMKAKWWGLWLNAYICHAT